jgi:hypothetical protein
MHVPSHEQHRIITTMACCARTTRVVILCFHDRYRCQRADGVASHATLNPNPFCLPTSNSLSHTAPLHGVFVVPFSCFSQHFSLFMLFTTLLSHSAYHSTSPFSCLPKHFYLIGLTTPLLPLHAYHNTSPDQTETSSTCNYAPHRCSSGCC